MKVGIIRCLQTEDYCPGTGDFRVVREKKGAFEGTEEDIEIVGFINCGGCPGKSLCCGRENLSKEVPTPSLLLHAFKRGLQLVIPVLSQKR